LLAGFEGAPIINCDEQEQLMGRVAESCGIYLRKL